MEEFFFSRCSFFGWVLYLITSVLSTVVFRRALSFQLLESKQICKIKNQSSQYRNYPKTWFQEKHKLIHISHPIIEYNCHSRSLLLKIATYYNPYQPWRWVEEDFFGSSCWSMSINQSPMYVVFIVFWVQMLIERERYPPVSFAYPIVLYECVAFLIFY